MLGAAKRKRPWLQRKLEDKDSKVLSGWKSGPKGRSKDPLGYMLRLLRPLQAGLQAVVMDGAWTLWLAYEPLRGRLVS